MAAPTGALESLAGANWWLKTAQVYYLTVLEVRCPELNALWELQGRLQLLLFQLPETAQSPTSASVYLSDSDPLRSLS